MRLEDLPRRMTICGGGYIAAEFAHVFDALGVDVTVVTRGPALLREQDELVTQRFKPKDAVELFLQEVQLEYRNDPKTLARAKAEGEDFLRRLKAGLI